MPESRLTDPGALLATTHEAGGGLRVRLRLARPTDALRVRELLQRLSSESVPDSLVRSFIFQNPRERLVLAATAPLDGGEELIGMVSVGLTSTGVAELGIVVDARTRNRGVGKLLTESVAHLAIRQGATHLRGELLPQSEAAVRRLMEGLGTTVEAVEEERRVLYATLAADRSRAA
jgi:GNAT superfamily N-acetyltransferase